MGTLTAEEQSRLKWLEELIERVSKEDDNEHWTAREQEDDDDPYETFTHPGHMP